MPSSAWFGTPPALAAFTGNKEGVVTGELRYDNGTGSVASDSREVASSYGWSGQFQFSNATLAAPGVALPLKEAQGHVVFNPENFDLLECISDFSLFWSED